METLTTANAHTASTITHKDLTSFGQKKFNHRVNGWDMHTYESPGFDTTMLSRAEFKFWTIATYKPTTKN